MRVPGILAVAGVIVAASGLVLTQAPGAGRQRPARTPAQMAEAARAHDEMMKMARPIDAIDSVWMEELTWLEVRDAIAGGKTTVIVPTGGIEQNGPYLVTGKHNYLNRALCEAIARKLGNALCGPNVPFVPGGDIDPPTGMMRFHGTISVTEPTFRALLTDIASSLKTHGFQHIVFIGDSSDNQPGMKHVAQELSARWPGGRTKIHYVPEFYDYPGARKFSNERFGWKEVSEGHHDSALSSAMIVAVNPDLARIKQRIAKNKASINAIPLVPVDRAVEWGRTIIDYRAGVTVAAIRKAVAGTATSAP
ncbi:MAG: creatininase family protein [Vicinamibacterales bacterium]